jgi:hypothetical protein
MVEWRGADTHFIQGVLDPANNARDFVLHQLLTQFPPHLTRTTPLYTEATTHNCECTGHVSKLTFLSLALLRSQRVRLRQEEG